jgi:hypothetical protein
LRGTLTGRPSGDVRIGIEAGNRESQQQIEVNVIMPATLQHLLEDVLDNIEDTGDLIAGSGGRLDDEQRLTVADHLSVALGRIEEAIGQLEDSGAPETCDTYDDPELVAGRCAMLARGLFDPAGRPSEHEDAIANTLQTIKHLIERDPGGLRSLVGLA